MPEVEKTKNSRSPQLSVLFCAVILIFVILVMYSPVLHHEFVYDDFILVKENADIHDFSAAGIRHIFFGTDYQNYLPLRALAYAAVWHFAGENPAPFHALNIIFHIINTILVFVLAGLLLNRAGSWHKSRTTLVSAFITAVLFAAHPLHVEAVTWISGFKELLSTFFCLCALLVYIRYRRRGMAFGYALLILFFAAALLSKATSLFLPFAFVLFDMLYPADARRTPLPHRLAEHLFIFLMAAGCAYLNYTLAAEKQMITAPVGGTTAHIATILKIIPFYMEKTLWPSALSVIYDLPAAKSFSEPVVLLSIAFLLVMFGVFLALRKGSPAAAFGLGFFVLALGPTLNVVPFGTLAADRYTYFALFGLCLAAGTAAGRIAAAGVPGRAVVAACLAIILGLYFSAARTRNEDWRNPVSLWEATVKTAPASAKAHMSLGVSYLDRNRMDDAYKQLQAARSLDPYYPKAYVALSLYYRKMGLIDKAYEAIQDGWRQTPQELELEYNFGIILFEMGNYMSAANIFFDVEAVFPGYKKNREYLQATLNELRLIMTPGDFMKYMEGMSVKTSRMREAAEK